MLVWASSEGSGETARMHRLAWTFAARIGDKHQIRLTRPNKSIDFVSSYALFTEDAQWSRLYTVFLPKKSTSSSYIRSNIF